MRAGDHAQTGKLQLQTDSGEEPVVDESVKVEYLGMDGEARQLYFNFIDGAVEIRNTKQLLEVMFRPPTYYTSTCSCVISTRVSKNAKN